MTTPTTPEQATESNATASQPNYQRMFEAACVALGEVGDALGCDPNEGGAEPILDAIQSLMEERGVFRVHAELYRQAEALLTGGEWQAFDKAATVEREACAKVCDGFDTGRRLTSDFKAAEIAAAIRARGHQTGAVS